MLALRGVLIFESLSIIKGTGLSQNGSKNWVLFCILILTGRLTFELIKYMKKRLLRIAVTPYLIDF